MVPRAFGAHHHVMTMHDCFGNRCYESEKPYCRIHSATSGSCQSITHCSKICGSLGGENGNDCCCINQECVNVFRHNRSNVYIPGANIVHLTDLLCYQSHDLLRSEMNLVYCHHDEDVCMFIEHSENSIEAKCISAHNCEHAKGSGHHHHNHAVCCYNNNCTYNQDQIYRKRMQTTINAKHLTTKATTPNRHTTVVKETTAAPHVLCDNIHDLAHHEINLVSCLHDVDICMFYEHHTGTVEAKCVSADDCEHTKNSGHHKITCCKNNTCTNVMVQYYKNKFATTTTLKPTTRGTPITTGSLTTETLTTPITNSSHLSATTTTRLLCESCYDIANCFQHKNHHCSHDEVCMFRRYDNTVMIHCEKREECFRLKNETNAVTNATDCCSDQQCIENLHAHYTKGEFATFPCRHCHDLLQDDCGHTRRCHSNEVCMIRHIDQRVETKCIEKEVCDFHLRHDAKDPNKFSICCGDVGCSQNAYNQSKYVIVQNGATEGFCEDTNNGPFSCADYVKDFDICKQKAGNGLSLATTICRHTCGLCPDQVTPSGQPTEVPYVLSTDLTNTTQLNESSSNSTTDSVTNPPCIDHDEKNICNAYGFYFCASTNGPGREFAVLNCAKTCNLCFEYYASLKNGFVANPFVEISTQSIETSVIVIN